MAHLTDMHEYLDQKDESWSRVGMGPTLNSAMKYRSARRAIARCIAA
jgi:hypothetical protein